jgi:ABC-type sulfate/molybdate transport systems ATPase subunit
VTADLLALDGVEVRRNDLAVLRDVSISLAAGEIIAVLGPNGAGKSTLLDAIGSVLRPSRGEITRHGRVATARQSADLAARRARANVELALAWWGTPRRERRARATAALADLNVAHLADRIPDTLSGGERRRVHLARAIALRPDILLLDEPFAGLDPESRSDLLDDAGHALRSNARAAIIVVHDRAEAWALADRLVVLLDGRVAAQGTPSDLLTRPPTPAVARFLGFTGELRVSSGIVMVRPTQVRIDPSGDLHGTVTRLTPTEDGARAEVATEAGAVPVMVELPGPAIGEQVSLRVTGGIRFPRTGEAP